jgi:hypothetical protein
MGLFQSEKNAAFETLTSLLDFVYNLSPKLKEIALKHMIDRNWRGHSMVGIQLRTGLKQLTKGWGDHFGYIQPGDVTLYWECAKNISKTFNVNIISLQ